MKRLVSLVSVVAMLLFLTAGAALAVPFTFGPDGGSELQGILNDITVSVDSSVNVTTDSLGELGDSYWSVDGSGGSIATMVIEMAGYAGTNTFGIYDATDANTGVELFAGALSAGCQIQLSILADGTVTVLRKDSAGGFLGFDTYAQLFSGNSFGFYLDATVGSGNSEAVFYSDTSLNTDATDHMLAYEGVGDTIQILPYSAGSWVGSEFILAWEDLYGGGDKDYSDFVVMVESVTPVPEPGTLLLLGSGILGLGLFRRFKK